MKARTMSFLVKFFLFVLFTVECLSINSVIGQTQVTINSQSVDISQNLDLTAVANLFGQVQNLEDFEKELNNPENHFSNLDLNGDGEIDYLRVVEEANNGVNFILLQAVLARDVYQDVATILVENNNHQPSVQVIGNSYIYGNNYVIEPVYTNPPVIYSYFYGPYFRPWRSPYYWGYYPSYFYSRPTLNLNVYYSHIHNYNVRYSSTYRYPSSPRSVYYNKPPNISRNDYAIKNPNKGFAERHKSPNIRNSRDLNYSSNKYPTSTREKNNSRDLPQHSSGNNRPNSPSPQVTIPVRNKTLQQQGSHEPNNSRNNNSNSNNYNPYRRMTNSSSSSHTHSSSNTNNSPRSKSNNVPNSSGSKSMMNSGGKNR